MTAANWIQIVKKPAQLTHFLAGGGAVLLGALFGHSWIAVLAIAAFSAGKELYDTCAGGAIWQDSLIDFGFYMAGAGAAALTALLKARFS